MRPILLLAFAVLAGCAQPVAVIDESSPAPLPEAAYVAAERAGSAVYRILPAESLLLVHVGRGGAMQRLGHEHAVASEDLQGLVAIGAEPATSRADIVFPIRNLVVDRHEYRQRLALDTEPSADDIAGTYTNMLKVLEPELYPWATMQAQIVSMDGNQATLSVSVTLHGSAFEYLLPVELYIDRERVEVSGSTTIRHSDFAIAPFTAAGGLLRVADELGIEFHLVGIAMQAGSRAGT